MVGLAELIKAITALIWPTIIAVFLWKVFPILKSIISSRGFNVKIAGIEISVQSATEQLQKQIDDLQKEILKFRSNNHDIKSYPQQTNTADISSSKASLRRIMWVDDSPENIALQISQLNSNDIEVVQLRSTDEALAYLEKDENFAAILSDMVRREGAQRNSQAGLVLLRSIRRSGLAIPFFVYTSARSEREMEATVRKDGGAGITSSSLQLLEWVKSAVDNPMQETQANPTLRSQILEPLA